MILLYLAVPFLQPQAVFVWYYVPTSLDSEQNIHVNHSYSSSSSYIYMKNRTQVDIGILDFSKAFDKVTHSRLVQKLKFYGIRGKPLQWIKLFLSNRLQQIVVEGSYYTHAKSHQVSHRDQFLETLYFLYILMTWSHTFRALFNYLQMTVWFIFPYLHLLTTNYSKKIYQGFLPGLINGK